MSISYLLVGIIPVFASPIFVGGFALLLVPSRDPAVWCWPLSWHLLAVRSLPGEGLPALGEFSYLVATPTSQCWGLLSKEGNAVAVVMARVALLFRPVRENRIPVTTTVCTFHIRI